MVGAEHPQPGGQHLTELGLSPSVITPQRHHPGDLMPRSQGGRVIRPKHPQLGGQHLTVLSLSPGVIILLRHREAVTHIQSV